MGPNHIPIPIIKAPILVDDVMKTSATSKLKEPEFQTLMQKLSVEQPAILDLAAAEEKTLEFTKGLRAGRRWSSRWSRRSE